MFKKPMGLPGLPTRINSVRTIFYILMAFGSITPCIAECNTTQWWLDPCNVTPTEPHLMEKFRHGRSVRHKSFLMDQLKRSINRSRRLLKEVEKIYSNETESVRAKRQDFKWLNATEMVANIASLKKFEKKLRKLQPNLQRFAGALEVLSCTQIRSHGHFNEARRNQILYNAKINLRAFICDVNEAVKPQFRRKIPLKRMNIDLSSQMNLTDAYFYDVQILKNLKWFFKQMNHKALKVKKKKTRKHVLQVHST